MRIAWIAAALVVWAVLSYAFVVAFAGAHVCALVQPVGAGPEATPIPEEILLAGCNRPDVGAIAASVISLLVILGVAWRTRPRKSALAT